MNLKNRILIVTAALMFLGLIVTSYSSYRFARSHAMEQLVKNELPLASDNIYSEVQRDLLGPQLVSSLMANDTFLKDWLLAGEKDQEAIKRFLAKIKSEYSTFTSFLISDQTYNYYNAEGLLKQISKDEPRDNWYFRVKNMPTQSELNVDKSLAHNDALTIFINYKILGYNGEFLGATGVGLNTQHVQQVLRSYREKYGNKVFFINPEGDIILHDTKSKELSGNIKAIEGLSAIAAKILSNAHGDEAVQTYTYEQNKHTFVLNTRFIKELGLTLAIAGDVDQKTIEHNKTPWFDIIIWLLVISGVMIIMLWVINQLQSKLQDFAWHDDLTAILNRKGFNQRYNEIEKSYQRHQKPFSLLLMDIDHFKSINDKHGHAKGDLVLKTITDVLNTQIRPADILARWGGEEFVLLLPETTGELASGIAKRIRKEVALSKELTEITGDAVTLSIGLCQHKAGLSMDENLAIADQYLYKAKDYGRNKVAWIEGFL